MSNELHNLGNQTQSDSTTEVFPLPPTVSWTAPSQRIPDFFQAAVTCQICLRDIVNPPYRMITFPICNDCLEFLRDLRMDTLSN